jgi:hypothetical protein
MPTLTSPLPSCPGCGAALGDGLFNQPDLAPCPACGVPVQVEVFPALFRPVARGRGGEAVMVEGESSCFYHPQKRAVVPCEGCGRFLCALCDCELQGEHFCPACLEVGRQKGRITRLENRRTLYDGIALSLALLPMLIFYFTIVTAPIALYIAIRYWNAPRSLVHRTKLRLVLAIILAVLQIGGWCVAGYFIVGAIRSNG